MTEILEYIKVEGHEDLERDMISHAIINRNLNAYEVAKKRAADAQLQRDSIRNATREINSLKSEIHEIKNMLLDLTKR
jgi:hypothetical protein